MAEGTKKWKGLLINIVCFYTYGSDNMQVSAQYTCRYFQYAHSIPIVVLEREMHINWFMVTCQGSTRLELP